MEKIKAQIWILFGQIASRERFARQFDFYAFSSHLTENNRRQSISGLISNPSEFLELQHVEAGDACVLKYDGLTRRVKPVHRGETKLARRKLHISL